MKTDFEKAAKEYEFNFCNGPEPEKSIWEHYQAGCEYAYSIDKETIERLEKEKEELKELVYRALNCTDHVHYLTIQEIKKELKELTPDN